MFRFVDPPATRLLIAAPVLALLAAPALAQSSSVTTSTQTTRTIEGPVATEPAPLAVPVPAPPPPPASYQSRTVTHSDNGVKQTDSASEKYVGPDGSRSSTKVIEQTNH
jgi:hypothetical protein